MNALEILQALYVMALESASASDSGYTYTYDSAYSIDNALINVFVSATPHSTGEIILTCENEQFQTCNFDLAANVLYSAIYNQ